MSALSFGADVVLTVPIEDSQYHVSALKPGLGSPWPDTQNGLLLGEETWLAVLSAQEYGTAELRVRVAESDPGVDDGDWEMVVERSLSTPLDTIGISRLYGQESLLAIAAPFTECRIRLHVTDRLRARQEPKPGVTIEKHLLQVWPAVG